MKKQTSFAKTMLLSLDELEKQGVLEGITFYANNYGKPNLNSYKLLFEDEIYNTEYMITLVNLLSCGIRMTQESTEHQNMIFWK